MCVNYLNRKQENCLEAVLARPRILTRMRVIHNMLISWFQKPSKTNPNLKSQTAHQPSSHSKVYYFRNVMYTIWSLLLSYTKSTRSVEVFFHQSLSFS